MSFLVPVGTDFSQIFLENRLTNDGDSCIIILERTFVHEHMNENGFGGGFIYGKYRED